MTYDVHYPQLAGTIIAVIGRFVDGSGRDSAQPMDIWLLMGIIRPRRLTWAWMGSILGRKPENIRLLILDVDGVLTDGSLHFGSDGTEYKAFNARDGAAIRWWLRLGRQMAWITGRESQAVTNRAENLGVKRVYQLVLKKLPVYESLLKELDIPAENTAYIGDDLMDLPIMTRCGFAVAVADAAEEVRAAADLVTELPGGRGAVAEAVRFLLKTSGDWEKVMARYTDPQNKGKL